VVLVLDRPALVQLVKLMLNHGLYSTRAVGSAGQAIAVIDAWRPHLVVFDADLDGQRIMQHVAAGAAQLPAIGLTRRGDLQTKLTAFEWGVDDILTVPFAPDELLARVVAVMRRSYGAAVTVAPAIKVGELEIDILNRTVRVGNTALHLTSLDQSLLYLLAANAGRVLTREQILDNLWGVDYAADSNVVDRHVRNLRAQLQNDWRRPRFIATVPGQGYRFVPTFTGTTENAVSASAS
jgi:DNA-binding response OmpR family regulator